MNRIKNSRIKDIQPAQQQNGMAEAEAQLQKPAQAVTQAEVPCSCPGCFSFDF